MEKVLSKIYWVFWLLPILFLPSVWISATAIDTGSLTAIEGTGFIVMKNYSELGLFYFFCTLALLLEGASRGLRSIKVLVFGMLICFGTFMLCLPRMIIGPVGLSHSGIYDFDFYMGVYRKSVSWQYTLMVIFLFLAIGAYYYFRILKEDVKKD